MKKTLDQHIETLVEISKEVEIGDPFDWADVAIDEEEAYKLMAMNVMDMPQDTMILAATITKLLVENMVLNYRLLNK